MSIEYIYPYWYGGGKNESFDLDEIYTPLGDPIYGPFQGYIPINDKRDRFMSWMFTDGSNSSDGIFKPSNLMGQALNYAKYTNLSPEVEQAKSILQSLLTKLENLETQFYHDIGVSNFKDFQVKFQGSANYSTLNGLMQLCLSFCTGNYVRKLTSQNIVQSTTGAAELYIELAYKIQLSQKDKDALREALIGEKGDKNKPFYVSSEVKDKKFYDINQRASYLIPSIINDFIKTRLGNEIIGEIASDEDMAQAFSSMFQTSKTITSSKSTKKWGKSFLKRFSATSEHLEWKLNLDTDDKKTKQTTDIKKFSKEILQGLMKHFDDCIVSTLKSPDIIKSYKENRAAIQGNMQIILNTVLMSNKSINIIDNGTGSLTLGFLGEFYTQGKLMYNIADMNTEKVIQVIHTGNITDQIHKEAMNVDTVIKVNNHYYGFQSKNPFSLRKQNFVAYEKEYPINSDVLHNRYLTHEDGKINKDFQENFYQIFLNLSNAPSFTENFLEIIQYFAPNFFRIQKQTASADKTNSPFFTDKILNIGSFALDEIAQQQFYRAGVLNLFFVVNRQLVQTTEIIKALIRQAEDVQRIDKNSLANFSITLGGLPKRRVGSQEGPVAGENLLSKGTIKIKATLSLTPLPLP